MHAAALEVVDGACLRGLEQSERVVERARLELGLRRRQRALCAPRGLCVSARRPAPERQPRRPARLAPAPGRRPAPAPRRRPRQDRLPPRPDARRAGPGRPARRSPLPTPDGPAVAPSALPPGRPPSAPADGEIAPCCRPRSGRSTPPARASSSVIPSRSAARHSSAGSPVGSAAATNKSRCVSSGSASSRAKKLSSIRPDSDSAPGKPNPPASCAAVSPRGSSNNANGLPRVSARSWSAIRSSSRPGITEAKSDRASAPRRPSHQQVREPCEFLARLARREQHYHRLRQQPARDERQRSGGGFVQPLRVVDHAQKRALLGRLRQQAEHRQADEEPIRHRHPRSART